MKKIFLISFIAFFMQYNGVFADNAANNTVFNKYYSGHKEEDEDKYYFDIKETSKMCGNYESTINIFRRTMTEKQIEEKLKKEYKTIFKIHLSCQKFINFYIGDIINKDKNITEIINIELIPLFTESKKNGGLKNFIIEVSNYAADQISKQNN